MRRPVLSILFAFFTTVCFSQRARTFMISVHADLIKSDNDGLFEKMQGGLEGSYYASRKFAVTAGAEGWSGYHRIVPAFGARFCPIDEAFVRVRVLPQKGYSLGGGFAKPLSEKVRIEAMADFYWGGQIAIRGGVTYGLGRPPR
jgi:hypothetical protein